MRETARLSTTCAVQQGPCSTKTSTILRFDKIGQILYVVASAAFGRAWAQCKTTSVVAPLVKQLKDLMKVKVFSKLYGKMASLWNYLYEILIMPLSILFDFIYNFKYFFSIYI